jgi:large-conductance mechanosensitive channel
VSFIGILHSVGDGALIIAFALFLAIKGINRLKTAEPPPAPAMERGRHLALQ